MEFEILETPLHFRLSGKSGPVPKRNYGEVGMQLMNEMWAIVKGEKIATTGINHWVYLGDDNMFTGVELKGDAPPPVSLEPLEFELRRYLKHLHIGPYQNLPAKWAALKAEVAARGETIGEPCLEVYGHHCDDPAKTETTILMTLKPRKTP
jgi:hypothetical protein